MIILFSLITPQHEQIVRWLGTLPNVDPKRISDEMAPAVAGIEWSDKGGWKVKLNDRVKALELIGRHLAMFKDRVEVQAMGQVLVYLPDNGRGGAAVDIGRVG